MSVWSVRFRFLLVVWAVGAAGSISSWADGPQDNIANQVRAVPPPGLELKPAEHEELFNGIQELEQKVAQLKTDSSPLVQKLLPDVEIFSRGLRQNVEHQELFSEQDVKSAAQVLKEGLERAEALANKQAPWTTQTGLVVRGYRSKIDQTVQPYGLEIPHDYSFGGSDQFRLDLWLHGRGEKVSETLFIHQRMNRAGQFQPQRTIVLHPYGRYCNAFKFAGEIDILEALEHAQTQYRIDENLVAVRGFSMGGAGCWQMAVHYPDRFFAANPGAGFSETPEFLKSFQQETLAPTWYEKKLWGMYDCPGYCLNLSTLPTVAYSGELDIQKQAADVMEAALAKEGLRLTHIIGPETKHAIHKDSAVEITEKLDQIASYSTRDLPLDIHFATYTLKYNRAHWIHVTGLDQHWEQARLHARLLPEQNLVELNLSGITEIELNFSAGSCPLSKVAPIQVRIESQARQRRLTAPQTLRIPGPMTDGSLSCRLGWTNRGWVVITEPSAETLKKEHNLQGPIDDAFMDAFVIVRPTGTGWHPATQQFAQAEMDRMIKEWRRHFRGDAIVVDDQAVTPEMAAASHLILFGDPASNSYLAKVVDRLPLQWTKEAVTLKGKT
ncbi:MAG: prolyl oligopeptidase family serine peptidase, partial [Planctomycetaceae bacterium]|nr:prolyl oligopeptidase family serine peptidase [Planctomycetaceae bacterium]